MGTLSILAAGLYTAAMGWRSLAPGALQFAHRHDARLALLVLAGASLAFALVRLVFRAPPGRRGIGLPAVVPSMRSSLFRPLRHFPVVLSLVGLAFFGLALADPYTSLSREEVSYPGRRISLLLDGSSSMMAPFKATQLNKKQQADIAFSTNVGAAEHFMRLRMKGRYRDLMALIEFGDEAYVITPFTNDYENILLSISLIGDLNEWGAFPDKGTIIAQAIEQSVNLFRAFDFLNAAGNVMVIFSDGQDTQLSVHGRSVYDILAGAVETKIPVYFIRTSFGRPLNGLIPDEIWKPAVERTGGKFYAAVDESAILQALTDIDRLSGGRIDVKQYTVQQPQFGPYAMAAVVCWSFAIALRLLVPSFRRFP